MIVTLGKAAMTLITTEAKLLYVLPLGVTLPLYKKNDICPGRKQWTTLKIFLFKLAQKKKQIDLRTPDITGV